MDELERLARLPESYARALQLRREGADEAAIAAALSIDPAAVGPLLRIADAKLAALTDGPDAGSRGD
jgi:hypothetical protein